MIHGIWYGDFEVRSMRDIPVFTTEYGVGSLVLREIPYRQEAYIRIQDTAFPKEFLEECVTFCRMAGAEKIYATGHAYLESFPLHSAIWKMQRSMENLPETEAMTMPVTEATLDQWRQIYNTSMADVPNASYMNAADGLKMLERGDGYFIHCHGQLLGIGIAADNIIQAIDSVKPGAGKDVLLALTHALSGETIELEVASANERAVKFYERLGFVISVEFSRWYRLV